MGSRFLPPSPQPPIQWVPGVLSPKVKWPRHEADHSLPTSEKVKNMWSYTFTSPYTFVAWTSTSPPLLYTATIRVQQKSDERGMTGRMCFKNEKERQFDDIFLCRNYER
jgi:hypothetical protein